MYRVLVIGYAPEATDLMDPALPSGLSAERIAEALKRDQQKMRKLGWQPAHLDIRADQNVSEHVLSHLKSNTYDCIVIGGGVRMTSKHVPILEQVVNAVRKGATDTPIAFNSGPDTSDEAAARFLRRK